MHEETDKTAWRDPSQNKDWVYRRGDIYIANLNPFKGSEQGGTRPVLVLQNNDGNYFCPTLIVAPLSSKLKKPNLPTHFLLKKGRGLMTDSIVELEQIKTIPAPPRQSQTWKRRGRAAAWEAGRSAF